MRPRGSQPPGAAYRAWLDAGGGSDTYDADRYMALLKDRGILAPRRGLIQIVKVVLQLRAIESGNEWDDEQLTAAADTFSRVLVDELGKDGWRIHDVVLCVRPGDPIGIGRPMTPEEEKQVGIWEGR